MGLDDSIVSKGFIKADSLSQSSGSVLFELFFFSHTTISIPNMLTYYCHNTKHVRIPLGTANSTAYFQDTGLPGCSAGWQVLSIQTCHPAEQKHCGNLKFRVCYFCNLTRLDDRGESVFVFEQ